MKSPSFAPVVPAKVEGAVAPIFQKIAVFADETSLPVLLEALPIGNIRALVVAQTRPRAIGAVCQIGKERGLPVLCQPPSKSPENTAFQAAFCDAAVDSIFCFSHALRVPPALLEAVQNRAVNVHYSLLPKNRGPNPLQWAILRGESQTGVTAHWMDREFDQGDVLLQRAVPIDDEDTWVTLRAKLGELAPGLIRETICLLHAGGAPRVTQNAADATQNPRLTPESPRIDFASMSDREVFNLIRAQVAPLRGAYVESPTGREYFPLFHSLDEVARLRARYA